MPRKGKGAAEESERRLLEQGAYAPVIAVIAELRTAGLLFKTVYVAAFWI